MWCIFKKLRGYLLIMQMMQLPLVSASRRWLRGRDLLGNLIFWIGIFTGLVMIFYFPPLFSSLPFLFFS